MKIAIVGLGKFGKALTGHLTKENHDLVVIDRKASNINDVVNEYDVIGFCGNGASYQTQLEAGLSNFDLLVATSSTDESNILSCLVAKNLGIKQTIARIRNPEYSAQIQLMNKDLGVGMPINPDLDTATEIFRILKFKGALKVETFANGRVEFVEIKVEKGSSLDNASLSSIKERYQANFLVSAVKRGNDVIIPKGEYVLKEGDYVYLSADNKEIEKVFKKLNITNNKLSSTMILGGGKIAYFLATLLIDNGVSVTIVDKDKAKCEELCDKLPQANIICGDATNQKLLIEEGIETTDAIVTLTGIDETNIIVSSFAKSVNSNKVITKLSNDNYDSLLTSLGLDSVVIPKELFSSYIIRYVRGMENSENRSSEFKTLYRLINNRVEASEFVISKETNFTSVPLKDLKIKNNILISCIIRNNEVIIPGGKDSLEVGDHVIIATTDLIIKDVSDILE